MAPNAADRLHCAELGLWLQLEDSDLVMVDDQTGERQLTEAEAARVAQIAVETEIARLRKKLGEGGIPE
jgi:hypothetical protein